MKIVIDTCSLFGDLKLTGAKIRTLCETSRITGDKVYLPQVVIDEVKNKLEEQLLSAHSNIQKELSELKRLTNYVHTTTFDKANFQKEVLQSKNLVDKKIIELGILIIPYPNTTHEVIVKKAVTKKKPFNESGKGYRDALIWENIKSICKLEVDLNEEPHLVFITGNQRDFCGTDLKLHSDLLDELKILGTGHNSIEVAKDIDFVIEKYCKPNLIVIDEIKNVFEIADGEKTDFRIKLENLVFAYLDQREFHHGELGLSDQFECPTVSDIKEDYIFNITEAKQLSLSEILINGSVEVSCTIETYIFRSEYAAMTDAEAPSILDPDWNDHYVSCTCEEKVKINFFLTVDRNSFKIISNELELNNE